MLGLKNCLIKVESDNIGSDSQILLIFIDLDFGN